MVIQTWVLGRHFLKNKVNLEPVILRDVFVVNDTIISNENNNLRKLVFSTVNLTASNTQKTF